MCHYCKNALRKKGKMPGRCVLNGLEVIPIPPELGKLDCLSRQFIQKAKAFQTVVRLGTYSNKVPTYNCLKACKGNVFFLPLPLNKTLETLEMVKDSLADPELYIIVNGQPTKSRVVWRSLVDVNAVKSAVSKLRDINRLYEDVESAAVDSAAKEVVEVVSKASVLEKASDSDVSELLYYTIRNLDTKLMTSSEIDQYKLLNVHEEPLLSAIKVSPKKSAQRRPVKL